MGASGYASHDSAIQWRTLRQGPVAVRFLSGVDCYSLVQYDQPPMAEHFCPVHVRKSILRMVKTPSAVAQNMMIFRYGRFRVATSQPRRCTMRSKQF